MILSRDLGTHAAANVQPSGPRDGAAGRDGDSEITLDSEAADAVVLVDDHAHVNVGVVLALPYAGRVDFGERDNLIGRRDARPGLAASPTSITSRRGAPKLGEREAVVDDGSLASREENKDEGGEK